MWFLADYVELMVCVVKASEIRRPVRSAKVRIAGRLRTPTLSCESKSGGDATLLGIADGIVPRPDLSSGVSMPKASYLRAAQYALSKLTHQLGSIIST